MRQGFYFSFDALIALTLLGLTTVLLLGTSAPSTNSGDLTVQTFQETNSLAEDAVQSATRSSLRQAFTTEQLDGYVNGTVLDESDTEKSVMDVISILWASNDSEAAQNISRAFFERIIPSEYGYSVKILDDGETLIFNSSLQNQPQALANSRRVVSGVQKNRPQRGYLSRARATSVEKNESRVLTFSPMGGANSGGKMNIWKRFDISNSAKVVNTTLYIAVHYGCDNSQFENLRINGNNLKNDIVWIHEDESCGFFGSGTGAYGVVRDVHQYIQNGTNTVYMRFRNNQYNAHTHPGMKLELELVNQGGEEVESPVQEKVDFDEVLTTEQGQDNSGAFAVKPFAIPQGATVHNATIHLKAEDVDQQYEDLDTNCGGGGETIGDVMVYFNGEQIYRDEAPSSGSVEMALNVTNKSQEGTNVVAAYFNTYGDCFWGDGDTSIEANHTDNSGSYINVTYSRDEDSLVFGKIDLTRNDQFGGVLENPKIYTKDFNGSDVKSSFLHVAQLFSNQVTVDVTDAEGNEEEVFQSAGIRSVPSSIFIDPDYYSSTGDNTIRMEDSTSGNDFLPESSLEYTLLVPSQVPYGDTFQNRSLAQEDARQRLNQTLGEFVDATEIASDTLSVNDVPWLFGPVTFEMEVWRK